ncbi:MAG TPA: NAD-dependent epimerase/dehydratase family protein [Aliidongia sp.]|nr:NAD-dependent epimerase/dehydratase family protein [Aliidongia sp.]
MSENSPEGHRSMPPAGYTGYDVVTGGAGFIGSHLVDRLLADRRKVLVIDSMVVGRPANLAQHCDNPDLRVEIADVSDRAAMRDLIQGADRVFHLAARADIVPSIVAPDDYYRSNVEGTFVVCEAARAAGVRRLVYAASSSCYGDAPPTPTLETAPIDPRYPYALTKNLGEQIVLHWADIYRLPALALRFFNVYGPRARTAGTYGAVFGVFLAQLLAGKPLTVVGDGTQRRDFTFVTDIVSALVAAAESERVGEVMNVGSGAAVSINRLVELLGAKDVVHIPKRPGEPDITFADITRIRDRLGWAPLVPIEAGVAAILEQIDYWRDAPVWTEAAIATATADWFKYLGRPKQL